MPAPISHDDIRFHDEDAARAFLEEVLWNGEPVCPHCGSVGDHYVLEGKGGKKGTKARKGVYKCQDCREQFTVTVGTVMEQSKVPLHKWVYAIAVMTSSKKGFSAHQLHRTIGVTYKTAWFMAHRLRLAMKDFSSGGLMGSGGGVVEADETYIGRKPGRQVKAGPGHKHMVFALVERDGEVRAKHIAGKEFDNIKKHLRENVSPLARLATDEARMYRKIAKKYAEHMVVNHSKDEYVRGEASTNTVEGFFSIFKRGMKGVYQHCSGDHLQRYVDEFAFRYNNRVALGIDDSQRAVNAVAGIAGKRLTYRTTD